MRFLLPVCAFAVVAVAQDVHPAEITVADSARKYRFLAKSARDKKQYAEAAGYYESYLRYVPDDARVQYRLGEMYFRTDRPVEATAALTRAVALDSLQINANILLYNLHLAAGRADSAAVCLERLLVAKPDDMDKRRMLADLYRREGRLREAIKHYEVLADQAAEAEGLIELVAVLYEDLGDGELALEWRRRLVADGDTALQDDKRLQTLETMVRLQLETGDVHSAYQTLLQLAETDTSNRYSYYSRIATLAEGKGDTQMLLRGWTGMVQANPLDLDTTARLVERYLNRERMEQARRLIDEGLRIEPEDGHLQLLRGDMLAMQDDEEGALAAFAVAMRDPRWQEVAQQRIWEIRPPETEEEKLRKAFFGKQVGSDSTSN